MWLTTYQGRLFSWNDLRDEVSDLPRDQALRRINQWWFETPWQPYGLHWDDFSSWPDPWQLLGDPQFCPVARALGIAYTISLLERDDMDATKIVMTDTGETLVTVDEFILNWDRDTIINTNPNITRKIQIKEVRSLYS